MAEQMIEKHEQAIQKIKQWKSEDRSLIPKPTSKVDMNTICILWKTN